MTVRTTCAGIRRQPNEANLDDPDEQHNTPAQLKEAQESADVTYDMDIVARLHLADASGVSGMSKRRVMQGIYGL